VDLTRADAADEEGGVPANNRFRIYQDLVVTNVAHEAHELTVHVRDPGGAGRRIVFRLADLDTATDLADQVQHWGDTGRPLTYVCTGHTGTLIDEEEAFHRAFRDDPTEWA
jgi:hypothetical protein